MTGQPATAASGPGGEDDFPSMTAAKSQWSKFEIWLHKTHRARQHPNPDGANKSSPGHAPHAHARIKFCPVGREMCSAHRPDHLQRRQRRQRRPRHPASAGVVVTAHAKPDNPATPSA
jgi:hypothetical protein